MQIDYKTLLTLFVFINISAVHAQDSSVQSLEELHDGLVVERAKAEEQIKPIIDEQEKLKEQQKKLNEQITAIEENKQKALSGVERPVPSSLIAKIMLENKVGLCKIQKGYSENEYYIERDGQHIRMFFAAEQLPESPKAKFYNSGEATHVEIKQSPFTHKEANNPMSAVLRLDKTGKVVHAVFNGEHIKDSFMGFSSSYTAYIITCAIE